MILSSMSRWGVEPFLLGECSTPLPAISSTHHQESAGYLWLQPSNPYQRYTIVVLFKELLAQ